jgi:protein transport protein SEC31
MLQNSSPMQGKVFEIKMDGPLLISVSSSSITKIAKHSGAIKALQFNPHRDDLLASSGAKGELYITNIANPSEPSAFRLGTSAARADDFDALDWNKKVAHILVTGSSGGFATVWDVRAKKESINLNNYGRKPVSSIAWDPTTPTKVATATSSDQEPVVLLWDLRNSNAPERILRQHDQGILSLSWSRADPHLLLSCGKDNRTICWNAQTGEPFGEFPIVTNWTFQTSWNPKHPGLLATASFDGKISVQTIQNTNPDTSTAASAQNLDGADFFASAQSRPQGTSFSLPVAPTWMKRPVSATFGFAGKLVHVGPTDGDAKHSKVSLSTFVVDSSVGEASQKFQDVLESGDIKGYCDGKIAEARTENEKSDWTVIETLISGSRTKLKNYLGFSEDNKQPNGKIALDDKDEPTNPDGDDISFFDHHGGEDTFLSGLASSKGAKTNNPFQIYTGNESDSDKQITRALILGKFGEALDICLKEKRMSDAFMVAICGGDACIEKVKAAYFKEVSGGPNYLRLLASVSGKSLWDVVYNADLQQWKEVMAAICTYADEKEFPDLCEALGDRIEETSPDSRGDASFCYLAGSKLEKVVNIWLDELKRNEQASVNEAGDNSSFFSIHANALQDFIEKVTVFREVTDFQDSERDKADDWKLEPLYAKYAEYADILASQGQLKTAERYLELLPSKFPAADVARNRVKQATRKAGAVAEQKAASSQRGQRIVSTFQPTQTPSIPAAASIGNPYAPGPGVPPAPAAATGMNQQASYNPPGRSAYTPMGYQQPQQQGYQPPQQGYQPPGSTFPAAQPFASGFSQFGAPTAPPPRTSSASPAVPLAARQSNIAAWNDTPEVGPRMVPRRGTPSVVHAPVNSPYANQASGPPPPSSSFGAPPKSSTPVPPPPKPGATRTLSPANTAPMPVGIETRPISSSAANAYSPPPMTAPAQAPLQRGASPYKPPPASGPPSNRYAPAPGSQPSGPPPPYNSGPPARTTASPYVSQPGPYGTVRTPTAELPAPTQTTPAPGPPPPRMQPPPPVAAASRTVNTLPSPQPSDSRPPSSSSMKQSAAQLKYRKFFISDKE